MTTRRNWRSKPSSHRKSSFYSYWYSYYAITIFKSNLSPQHRITCYQTQPVKGEVSKICKASTKKILHQRKFKNFNYLKYKPKAQIKATALEETENKEKPTYTEILRKGQNSSTRQNLRTNFESNTKPNIHQKLWSMSPTNLKKK